MSLWGGGGFQENNPIGLTKNQIYLLEIIAPEGCCLSVIMELEEQKVATALQMQCLQVKRLSGVGGAWMASWAKCLTLDFGLGGDFRIVRSSPMSGSMICAECA